MLDVKGGWAPESLEAADAFAAPSQAKRLFGPESLLRHKKVVMGACAAFFALGLVFADFRAPTYTASTHLLVYNRELVTGPDSVIHQGRADAALVQNQMEIIQSRSVLLKLVDSLNLTADPEFAGAAPGLLQSLKSLLPLRRDAALDESIVKTAQALDSIRHKLKVHRVGSSYTMVASFTASTPKKAAYVANELARAYLQEVRVNEAALSKAPALRERFQGLGPNAYVISEAAPPIHADGPSLTMIALGAAFLGLGVGAALALLIDLLDRTIRTPEQIESLLGFECFGAIPRLAFAADEGERASFAARRPQSLLAQALRRAAAALQEASPEIRSLGVTSVAPGEGATLIAANLARVAAGAGKRVLLIDGVTDDPSLTRLLAPNARRDLAASGRSFAAGGVIDQGGGVHVLPAAASSVWRDDAASGALLEFIPEACESYDLVIVDMPSLAAGPQVRMAGQTLDGFLLVVKWGDTGSELIRGAMRSAGKAQAKFIGSVLNMADEKTMGTYGYKLFAAEAEAAGEGRLSSRPSETAGLA